MFKFIFELQGDAQSTQRVIWSDFWIDRLGIIIETNVKKVNVKDANIMSIQLV